MTGTEPGSVLDRLTLLAMVCGLAVMLWPGWDGALKLGFFGTLGATVAQIVVGHLRDGGRGKA
jgi:predicted exporter